MTLHVRDSGPGVPAAERERIFERFYRVDQSRGRHTGGSGLGLAICREGLAVLGGTIGVADSAPAGTTVDITLPGRRPAPSGDPIGTGAVSPAHARARAGGERAEPLPPRG